MDKNSLNNKYNNVVRLNILSKFTAISVKVKLTEHQTRTFLQNNRKPGKKSWKFDDYSLFFIVTNYTAMHISGLFSTP